MNLTYNENWLTILYDANCVVDPGNIAVLLLWNFTLFGGIWKGSVARGRYSDYVFSFPDLSILNRCLVYFNWDIYMTVEETYCNVQLTNHIYYQSIQKPNAWHLDALDKQLNHRYSYASSNNHSVDIWILDTGVNWKHREFQNKQVIDVDGSFTIVNLTHPHGTGTACAAGGVNYGSSKNIPIYNFPICRQGGSCGSSWADQAFKRILQHLKEKPGRRSVINMSVGSYYGPRGNVSALSQYYNAVFEELMAHGAIIVVAAGNSNTDACNWIYSFSPFVISVGSIDDKYNKSGFSNWGECVDIWAFGNNIPVAYSITDPTLVQHKSGTSFSAPIVSGLIANILLKYPTLHKEQILEKLYDSYNNYLVPVYVCGAERKKCCQGYLYGTRLDDYCRKKPFDECPRSCKIDVC